MKKLIIILCLGLLVVACEKKEEPATLLDKASKAVSEKTEEAKAAAKKAQAEAEKKAAEAQKKAAEATK